MKNETNDLIGDLKTRREKYDEIFKFFGENGEELAAVLLITWFIFTLDMDLFKWFHYLTAVPLVFLLIGNFSRILHLFYGVRYIKRFNNIGFMLSFGVLSGYATWAYFHNVFPLLTWISVIPPLMLVVALVFIHLSLNISKEILERLKKYEQKFL